MLAAAAAKRAKPPKAESIRPKSAQKEIQRKRRRPPSAMSRDTRTSGISRKQTVDHTSCTAVVPFESEDQTARETTTRSARTCGLEKKSTRSAVRNDSSSRGTSKLQKKGSSKIKLETRKRLQILSMMRKSTEPKGPKTRDKMIQFFDSFFEREENKGKFNVDDKERFKQEFFQNFGDISEKKKPNKSAILPALEWHNKEPSTPQNNNALESSSQITAATRKNKRKAEKSPSVKVIDRPPRSSTSAISTKASQKGHRNNNSKPLSSKGATAPSSQPSTVPNTVQNKLLVENGMKGPLFFPNSDRSQDEYGRGEEETAHYIQSEINQFELDYYNKLTAINEAPPEIEISPSPAKFKAMQTFGATNSNKTHVIIPYPAAAAAARSSTGSNYTTTTDQHPHLKYAYGPPANSQKQMRLHTDESKRLSTKTGAGYDASSTTLEPQSSVHAITATAVSTAQVSSARLPPVSNPTGGTSTHSAGSSTLLPDINKRAIGIEKEETASHQQPDYKELAKGAAYFNKVTTDFKDTLPVLHDIVSTYGKCFGNAGRLRSAGDAGPSRSAAQLRGGPKFSSGALGGGAQFNSNTSGTSDGRSFLNVRKI